ncbi:MAG TPA: DUF1622 domain-containing protein [Rhizomicrobium sp.]|nr:DUF1622 domain-containing protein [Rhizomicrobium sp.]
MEDLLRQLAGSIARAIEVVAIILIGYGAGEAFAGVLPHLLRHVVEAGWRKALFVRFGTWLILGLQFALAADIVRSVISPTWTDIGQLAAIAAIRTFLNYFLERDLEEMDPKRLPPSQLT